MLHNEPPPNRLSLFMSCAVLVAAFVGIAMLTSAVADYRSNTAAGSITTFKSSPDGSTPPVHTPVVQMSGAYPAGSTAITASATGTTAATAATLAGVAAKTTHICGAVIRANATAAATGNATIAGTITATMNFTQWTAPLASGLGEVNVTFTPCVPASAVNTGIVVTSAAPGTGGTVSVSAWGYQQ